jgi:uncharacterized protein YndB with AHSA1/START domain
MTPDPLSPLPHELDRTLVLRARRETVFRYFTDSLRWAKWWGAGSRIDPEVGGKVFVRHPNAVEAAGEVVEIDAPNRIVFTYGFASGQPMGVGESLVTITLEEDPEGTRLRLVHAFSDATARDHHVQGWRYQLSVFANVVAAEVNAGAQDRIDAWFAAWSEPDAARRDAALDAHVAPQIRFRDRFSSTVGIEDLRPHLAAVHQFMPGMKIERRGPIHHCQGTALCEWTATGSAGEERGQGTNIFTFDAEGRIIDVVGLWIDTQMTE